MKKAFLLLSLTFFLVQSISAQKRVNFRIFGAPDFMLVTNTEKLMIKNLSSGFFGGGEVMYNINESRYLFTGLNYGNYNIARENFASGATEIYNESRTHSLEVPLGIGFNLGKSKPEGLFLNLAVVNNFSFSSRSDVTFKDLGLEITRQVKNSPIGVYNLGGKLEIGHKTPLSDKTMCSISIGAKPMFWNITNSAGTKTTTWSSFLAIGVIF